jgi:hypothetical protein
MTDIDVVDQLSDIGQVDLGFNVTVDIPVLFTAEGRF